MPYDRGRLNGYKFFHDGGRFDQVFIENVLLPGLSTQAKFAGGSSGVELPHGQNDPVEYLPLRDAAQLALDWFVEHQNLEESEARNIETLIGKSSYVQISDTLSLVLHKRVQDPQKLLKSRLIQNVAELQHVKDLAALEQKSNSTHSPASNLLALSKLQAEITRLANSGVPPAYIDRLIPRSLTGAVGTLTQQRLIDVIVSNPSMLRVAALHPESREVATQAVANEFNQLLSQYPDLDPLRNFTGTDEFVEGLYGLTSHLNSQLEQNKISVDYYMDLKLKASYDLPHLLPSQSQLLSELTKLNTFSSDDDRAKFARAVVGTMVSSSNKSLTADQIVTLAGAQLGIPSSQIGSIFTTLQSAGVLPAIEYQQNELHYDVSSRRLTTSERSLLHKGINPFHAHFQIGDLRREASGILSTPNLSSADAQFKIQQLYEKELNSPNPSRVELSRLKGWLDRYDTLTYLEIPDNSKLKRLADRSRTERWLTDISDRLRSVETNFYNKWVKLDEKLPWNVASRKFFEWYDKLAEAEGTILKIPIGRGRKLNIPLFKLAPWLFDQWDKFKRVSTLKAYANLSKPWKFANPIRKSLQFTLKQYSLGGYSVDGAVFRYGHKLWGKGVAWAVSKAGIPSLVKYPATWGARVLIKLGGKALAKAGIKVITALAAAGTVIASALSIVAIAGLIFDVLKLGYDLIKKFIQDIEFRKQVLKIGAFIGGVTAFILGIPIFALVLAIGAVFVHGFIIAFGWTFGILAASMILWNTFNTTISLDSGSSTLINIVCNLAGTDPDSVPVDPGGSQLSNSTLVAGQCIHDLLVKFNINPLTAENAAGSAWTSFVSELGNESAASIIHTSATGQGVFQCVGYIAGVGAMIGKAFSPRNACLYVNNPPSGYTWTTKPTVGCFFVIASNTCSQCGQENAPANSCGHVGVVSGVNGAIINAMDANGTTPWGMVRVNAQFPISSIAGYMCP